MAYFVMEKMPDMGKTGKQVLYPKLKGVEPMDVEAMVERIARTTTFGVGEVKGVLHELVGEMAHALAQGRSVKLEGLGTFTPTLALRKGKGQEEAERSGTRLNRASVEVGNVRFRVDKGLLGHINTVCNLHRAPGKRVYSSRRYTPEQRLELARQYLDTHPTM